MLKKHGLVDFRSVEYPTILDITDNPKHLKFEELDAPLLPRALSDVVIAVIPSNFALMGRLDPNEALIKEEGDSPYANIVVVRKDDHRESLEKLEKVLNSKEISDFIREKYKGAIIPTH